MSESEDPVEDALVFHRESDTIIASDRGRGKLAGSPQSRNVQQNGPGARGANSQSDLSRLQGGAVIRPLRPQPRQTGAPQNAARQNPQGGRNVNQSGAYPGRRQGTPYQPEAGQQRRGQAASAQPLAGGRPSAANGHAPAQPSNGHTYAQSSNGNSAAQPSNGHSTAQPVNGYSSAQPSNGYSSAQSANGHISRPQTPNGQSNQNALPRGSESGRTVRDPRQAQSGTARPSQGLVPRGEASRPAEQPYSGNTASGQKNYSSGAARNGRYANSGASSDNADSAVLRFPIRRTT